MNAKKTIVVMAFVAIAAWAAACSSAPTVQGTPEEARATRTSTIQSPTPSLRLASTGEAVTTPEAGQTSPPRTVLVPTPTEQATSLEEDCMAECHIPDPSESFGAGAKPLPASHAGRTGCLDCHAAATAPVLPATHAGRLDESCRGCHR